MPNPRGQGEFRYTAPVLGRLKLLGATDEREFHYSAIENEVIFEGDIVLKRPDHGLEGIVIAGVGFRWPNAVVFYSVRPDLPNPERVTQAIAEWEAQTRIRFRQRTNEANFVTFRPGGGCSSQVGMQGGEQFITLGPNCTKGNVIHEIGHAVVLWHEQSREDRDKFIKIHFENVLPDAAHNFNQHITDGDDVGAYDYGSIMHYPANAFAIDPSRATITTPNGESIGQRTGLSAGDIAAVAAIYP
jgi:hypothetical protein